MYLANSAVLMQPTRVGHPTLDLSQKATKLRVGHPDSGGHSSVCNINVTEQGVFETLVFHLLAYCYFKGLNFNHLHNFRLFFQSVLLELAIAENILSYHS